MAKPKLVFVCSACQHVQHKWTGQCEECKEWNTLKEAESFDSKPRFSKGLTSYSLSEEAGETHYLPTGISEFDRVLGGGLVPGSVVMISGEPGIGKSTLLLQMSYSMDSMGFHVLYVSGEEAVNQIRMRAKRISNKASKIEVSSDINSTTISNYIQSAPNNLVVIIDSIQTLRSPNVDSSPGSSSQVKTCADEITRAAKEKSIPVIFVGHLVKDGSMAGPKHLEHMVDVVLDFSGSRNGGYRILRTNKNRYGATDEIGVFEMREKGLIEVSNPSSLFLSDVRKSVSGCSVFPILEGTRPVLAEVQVLISESESDYVRRSVVGWDHNRLNMILAVLKARCNISFASDDVYLNIVGGLSVKDPAMDLAVVASLLSAKINRPLPSDFVFFGEVGLSGEIRQVQFPNLRMKEAQKLGFKGGYSCAVQDKFESFSMFGFSSVCDFVAHFLAEDVALKRKEAKPKESLE